MVTTVTLSLLPSAHFINMFYLPSSHEQSHIQQDEYRALPTKAPLRRTRIQEGTFQWLLREPLFACRPPMQTRRSPHSRPCKRPGMQCPIYTITQEPGARGEPGHQGATWLGLCPPDPGGFLAGQSRGTLQRSSVASLA